MSPITVNAVRYGIPRRPLHRRDGGLGDRRQRRHRGGRHVHQRGARAVLLLNVLFRIGVEGDKERDREEEARRFFDEHGRWPDE